MRYVKIKDISNREFKRLTGVTPKVFALMVETVKEHKQLRRKCPVRGRPPKISEEDKVLMLLMYYREYRTFFHTGKTYDISEMHCWITIREIENILIASKLFHIPGKKALRDGSYETVVVDVSEHPVERPKKNKSDIIRVKRNVIRKKVN
jgi:hypothetical protein